MKKEITQEQFNDLNLREQTLLAEKMNGMCPFFIGTDEKNKVLKDFYSFPDIAMMIEFIGEDWWQPFFKIKKQRYVCEDRDTYEFLCDELWDLTKKVLRERYNTSNS